MSQPQPPLDEHGEAHEALNTAVASYGPRILQSPQMLGNVVTDLLPDLPREQSLLIAAAEAGVATDLTQRVRGENLDAGPAVQLVAHALADHKSIDAAASLWVTTEYARALGYTIPQSVPSSPPLPPFVSPPPPPPTSPSAPPPPFAPQSAPSPAPQFVPPAGAQSVSQTTPQSVPPAAAQSVPPGATHSAPPSPPPSGPSYSGWGGAGGTPGGPWAGSADATVPGGPSMPGGPPMPPGSGKKRNRGVLIAAIAAAAVLVIYVVTAAAAQIFPFSAHSKPIAKPTSSLTPKPKPTLTPTPTSGPTVAAGVANLAQLLPGDLGGTASQCKPMQPPYLWQMPGLVQAFTCADPNLPGGSVYAFQMDSSAHFLTGWQNFDTWWGFNPTAAQNTCPPNGTGQGTYGWNDSFFPATDNQVVECGWVGTNSDEPAYAWALPTEDAFLYAVGASGSAFSDLNYWWVHHSDPSVSPTPAVP